MNRKDAELVAQSIVDKLRMHGSIEERMVASDAQAIRAVANNHAKFRTTVEFVHADGTEATYTKAELIDINPRWVGILTRNHGMLIEDRTKLKVLHVVEHQ